MQTLSQIRVDPVMYSNQFEQFSTIHPR